MFDTQRRLTRLARPMLQRVSGIPIAGDEVFGAIRRFYDRLDGVRELLTDGDITSARLVVNPERLVVAEARRTYTYLSLFGYHVDAVDREPHPPDRARPSVARRSGGRRSRRTSTSIADAFAPLPMLTAELANEEILGMPALSIFAKNLYGDVDVAGTALARGTVPRRRRGRCARAVGAAAVHRTRRRAARPHRRRAVR